MAGPRAGPRRELPARGGGGPTRPTFQRCRVQFGCCADSPRDAEVLAAEVEAAVDGFTGMWGDVPIASALVDVSLDDRRPDVGRYRRIVDVLIGWSHER